MIRSTQPSGAPSVRSAITVSLVPETWNGPFVYSSGLENAALDASRLGFDAIEIFPPSAEVLSACDVSQIERVPKTGPG